MTNPPDLTIAPLTSDRLGNLATLFEQGGDPKWCWCAYFRVRSFDFSKGSKAKHRSVLEAAAADGTAEGRAPGLVAYDGTEAVGWISIGPREDYERLVHSRVLAPVDDSPVWSIVCFVVGRRSRGRGIARALLAAAIAYAREHGATMLEAYPVESRPGGVSRRPTSTVARCPCSKRRVSRSLRVARSLAARPTDRSSGWISRGLTQLTGIPYHAALS